MTQYLDIIFSFEAMRLGDLILSNKASFNQIKTPDRLCQWILEELDYVKTTVSDITYYESLNNTKQ